MAALASAHRVHHGWPRLPPHGEERRAAPRLEPWASTTAPAPSFETHAHASVRLLRGTRLREVHFILAPVRQ